MAAKTKASAGSKATYETAEELQKKLDKYFADGEKRGEVPSESGLALYLGVTLDRKSVV